VVKRTEIRTPYFAPNQPAASVVAEAEAADRNRFWPIRITASRRGVCDFSWRMSAPRRSPFSRIRWRSIRPRATRAVSDPAKSGGQRGGGTNAGPWRGVVGGGRCESPCGRGRSRRGGRRPPGGGPGGGVGEAGPLEPGRALQGGGAGGVAPPSRRDRGVALET